MSFPLHLLELEFLHETIHDCSEKARMEQCYGIFQIQPSIVRTIRQELGGGVFVPGEYESEPSVCPSFDDGSDYTTDLDDDYQLCVLDEDTDEE